MKNNIFLIGFACLLWACNSVAKYNEAIESYHTADELKEDVDIAYEELQKFQPQLYQYISKEKLDYSVDSFKNTISKPMKSKTFAIQLSKVMKKVGQGHNKVFIPNKRFTRKEKKEFQKYDFDYLKLHFNILQDTVFVEKNLTKDSLYTNALVIAINEEPVHELISKYRKLFSSDGYNTTLHDRIIASRLQYFRYGEYGREDSVSITFQNQDSTWVNTFKRYLKKEKKAKQAEDSIKAQLTDINHSQQHNVGSKKEKLTKAERKAKKEKEKIDRKNKNQYGYDLKKEEYAYHLDFIGKDSSVAYLKIRSFSRGRFKKVYEEVFQKIDSAQAQNLIIDLRDNTGGRLDDIDELYSYLVDEKYTLINPSEITKRSSFIRALYGGKDFGTTLFLAIVAPIAYPYSYIKTKRGKDGKLYQKFSNAKEQDPKDNNFKGNLYIILNGTSFSASSIFATAISERENVTFVGEEAGGDFNGTVAGTFKLKNLPNTKVKIAHGIYYVDSPIKREIKGKGLVPDVEIQTLYSDHIQGKDAEVEWILNDIQSK